jgi:hypothetical protein
LRIASMVEQRLLPPIEVFLQMPRGFVGQLSDQRVVEMFADPGLFLADRHDL